MADKPRTRATAEDLATNLDRYKLGSFGPDATGSLGIKIVFGGNGQQGVAITQFLTDSTAAAGGLLQFDRILEVDSSAIGKFRNRFYEPFRKFGRNEPSKCEVLVEHLDATGVRKFYYPKLDVAAVFSAAPSPPLPPDFFTAPKPVTRPDAEKEQFNLARYVFGASNFARFSPYELGVGVVYSEEGGKIDNLTPGGAADRAGLKVGDLIMEIDGCPVGQLGDRLYELWRQYFFSPTGDIELLVAFKPSGSQNQKFYYPQFKLDDRQQQS